MQRRFQPRRVKSEHTAVHIYFTARRAKHTGAGGHAEPSLCSLKPRASEESRSIVSRFLCLWREEGLVSCEGRLESTCKISGAASSTPSLGWQFASTWRWFTRTSKCIADLPACWMDGWIEWTGIMRRVKGNPISPMGCNPLFIKGPVCHFQWPLVVGKNIAGKWTSVSFSCAMFTLEL